MEFVADTPQSLRHVVDHLRAQYSAPRVFVLDGEMGAGKTTLVRTYCEARGVDHASSPTFGLVNEYRTSDDELIYHFDLYRLRSLEEALDFGFEEYLTSRAHVFIEWADHVLPLLDEYVRIAIRVEDEQRLISIEEIS